MKYLRMMWDALLILVFIIVSIKLMTVEAQNIEIPDRHHTSDKVYYVGSDCPNGKVYDIIEDVFEEVERYSVKFTAVGEYNSFDQDNINTINCASSSPFTGDSIQHQSMDGVMYVDCDLMSEDGKSVLGTARVWFVVSTGRIVEFDIWLSTLAVFGSRDSIRALVRHEVGHALGLPHSWFKESLMYRVIGVSHWDIESIAKLSLSYEKCTAESDEELNIWFPNINGVYGIMRYLGEGKWDTVSVNESSSCQ